MPMILYSDASFTSPYVMSAYVALTQKNVSFEIRTLNLAAEANHEPEFARLSLSRRVPTLVDGNFALSESSAIAEYLEDSHPNPPIFPEDLQSRSRARQIQAWLRSDLVPLRQERPTSTIFYRKLASAPLSSAAQICSRKLFAAAAELLSHGGNNLFGRWSIADVDLALMLNRLVMNGDEVPTPLVSYAKEQWKHSAIQDWMQRERPPL